MTISVLLMWIWSTHRRRRCYLGHCCNTRISPFTFTHGRAVRARARWMAITSLDHIQHGPNRTPQPAGRSASSAQQLSSDWRNRGVASSLFFWRPSGGAPPPAVTMSENCIITLFKWQTAGDQACRFCFGPAEAVSTQVALKKRKNGMLWFENFSLHVTLCTEFSWLIDCFFYRNRF
jgi:hypothetical protein